jgi:hypothetical protein
VVNFAAGRLDAEHDPGLALEEIEKAVRDAGYGVERAQEVERPPFWRTPRAICKSVRRSCCFRVKLDIIVLKVVGLCVA